MFVKAQALPEVGEGARGEGDGIAASISGQNAAKFQEYNG